MVGNGEDGKEQREQIRDKIDQETEREKVVRRRWWLIGELVGNSGSSGIGSGLPT